MQCHSFAADGNVSGPSDSSRLCRHGGTYHWCTTQHVDSTDVSQSLDLCDNYPLTEESLTALSHRLLGLLKDFFDRVDERVEKRNEEDFDEVEAARAEATEKREDQVMEVVRICFGRGNIGATLIDSLQIAGLMGKLVEKHKEQFIPYFNHIACTEHFHKLLVRGFAGRAAETANTQCAQGPASRPVYRQSVICIFDDVVQFGGPAGVPFFEVLGLRKPGGMGEARRTAEALALPLLSNANNICVEHLQHFPEFRDG